MDQSEFERLTTEIWTQIEVLLEAEDIDYEWPAAGVIEADLPSGVKLLINRHEPSQEIWVAGNSGAFHFRHDGAQWRDTRDGKDLMSRLHCMIGRALGE